MSNRGTERPPSYDELRRDNDSLRAQNEELRRRVAELEQRIQQLEQQAFRQAAPFRRPPHHRKATPGRPGRKPGHPGIFRPTPGHVDETMSVPLEQCPHCGGPVDRVRDIEQFIEEIPPIQIHVTRLITQRGHCPHCGWVRTTHPMQMSLSSGCAKVQLGPMALALAADLKHRIGLTYRKLCSVLRLLGLSVSAGGLVQALARVARKLTPLHQQIAQAIRAGPAVYADETSWWVGGPGWWLWVFTTPRETFYWVDSTRGAIVVEQTLGEHFSGVLVSDCLASYDPISCTKHKCYAHHLKALSEAIEQIPPAEAGPLRQLRGLLIGAKALHKARPDMAPEQFALYSRTLRANTEALLAQSYTGLGVEKALHRFRTHREHLFTFFDHPEVDPTNNLAERQLRPAVVARKLSCGNKTDAGRRTWQILSSLATTCSQRTHPFTHLVAAALPLFAPVPSLPAAKG